MKYIFGAILTCSLLLQSSVAYATTPEQEFTQQLTAITDYLKQHLPPSPEPLTHDQMRTIIDDSVAWTIAAQEGNGHFGYEYEPFTGEYLEGEGMVRQAGTLFMLSEVYKHQTVKDPGLARAIERSIGYFEDISLEGEDGAFRCIRNREWSNRCELGSVALTLIGIVNYLTIEPEQATVYNELLEDYVHYLMAAKFEGRGFSNRYYESDGFSDTESPFYNGEAMLALVRYYQYQPDPAFRELLHELFVYLSTKEPFEPPLYLWIMAALKDMQRLWPNQQYVEYTREVTAARVSYAYRSRSVTHNYCAPLEGLVSARTVLESSDDTQFLAQLDREIDFWLKKSAWLQLDGNRPYRLIRTDEGLQLHKQAEPRQAHGGFLTSEKVLTQRIDFTQHCASAYLQKLVDIDGRTL